MKHAIRPPYAEVAHSEHAIVNFAAEPSTHAAVAPAAPAGMPLTLKGANFASGGSGAGGPGENHASFGRETSMHTTSARLNSSVFYRSPPSS